MFFFYSWVIFGLDFTSSVGFELFRTLFLPIQCQREKAGWPHETTLTSCQMNLMEPVLATDSDIH